MGREEGGDGRDGRTVGKWKERDGRKGERSGGGRNRRQKAILGRGKKARKWEGAVNGEKGKGR